MAVARRARRRLRRHRHVAALRDQRVLRRPSSTRLGADARQRARHPVADLLVARCSSSSSSTCRSSCAPTTTAKAASSRSLALRRSRRATSAARARSSRSRSCSALFGAALLYGDGVITPAISVLGAVEGLEVATHSAQPIRSCPITVGDPDRAVPGAAARHRAASARLRPGDAGVVRRDRRRSALPCDRARTRRARGGQPALRGRVPRCTTACTASCCSARSSCASPAARRCTRTWATSGDGRSASPGTRSCSRRCCSTTSARARCSSSRGAAVDNPFYDARAGHGRSLIPMVVLATLAAVIASQALISGAFSLTQQAVQLGYWPRVTIVHTSAQGRGPDLHPRGQLRR